MTKKKFYNIKSKSY